MNSTPKPLRFLRSAAAILRAIEADEVSNLQVSPVDGGLFDVRVYWTPEEKWTGLVRVSPAQHRRIVAAML